MGHSPGRQGPALFDLRAGRRDLHLLCAGVATSTGGTALTALAVAFHLRPVGSWAVAAGLAAAILPAATGALWAGPLADRYPAKRLIATAALISATAVALAAGIAMSAERVWLLLLLVLTMGAGAALASPALAALVPALVGESASTRAFGSYGAARSAGVLAGFALGGVLVEHFGIRTALLLDALSFVVLAVVVTLLRRDRRPVPDGTDEGHESGRSGLAVLGRDVVLRVTVGGLALAVVGTVLIDVAGVFFVVEVVPGGNAVVFGAASAAWGVGSLVGAKLGGRFETLRGLVRGLGTAHLVMGVALAVCGAVPVIAVLVVTWLVAGTANGTQNVCVQAVVRARSAPHLRGRAFAAASSSFQTASAAGLAVGAIAVPAFGAQGAILASALLPAAAGGLTLLLTRHRLGGVLAH